ncbi:head GIN domain-containing protein [Lacibacter sp.]|uniref:head GIN domain-containing protein n=1 Tax=Lacibacter sp. TaxID=1915409 RepID=UPI002B4B808A|nr:head GIN domain-containing protein [Lacibacter sp.]HLP35833.1 head GIN domain-containing protein [Lacibacter sp.]
MKKIVLSTLLFVAATPVLFAQETTVINDKNAEARKVSGFHGIKISNAFDVIIKQGNEEAVVVSASEEKFRDRIKVNVVNGILQISYDNEKVWKWSNENRKLRAYISVKNIDKLDVSGATDIKIDGVLKGSNLKVDLSGASSLKGAISYASVTVDQSGASNSKLSGTVTNLDVDVSGASDFTGFDLITENCRAEASGASDVKITVNKDLKVDASGASDVQYKGTASISDFRTTGASSLKKRSK